MQTPFLTLDPAEVEAAYRRFTAALPDVVVCYAMKCQPHPAVLRRLAALGSSFEVASAAELDALVAIGVDPAGLLFSHPVKPPAHIAHAYAAGLRAFAADSVLELDKLAAHAPGSRVYLRMAGPASASVVASEGKFGVSPATAADLLRAAADRGLAPYGLTFHVGSQMLDPEPWVLAIKEAGAVMAGLAEDGIRLGMLDIGGGFPVPYATPVPPIGAFAARIRAALAESLPYDVAVVAEPGRYLAAAAGTLTATVVGVAERPGGTWLHLDAGAFHGLIEALETGNTLRFPVTDSRDSPRRRRYHLTGPSCDSQDTIQYDEPLSADLTVGDRVYFGAAGAYTTAYSRDFNGLPAPTVHCR
ncbi:ornithine decarboxylase [Pilimelia anulata]|uniref:Ornithine decarboxylase n=1 Tax=Pilimelia anulata TaxID=53371 RepID=A0A8J3BCG9_9ACTN|nr:type III PLP-dependent enzyme [Pilimelia anulata]GGJ94373.1 ornithine decarboxylase [Pilimelia anulata]